MSNPVLVEVTRGAFVESRHRGAIAIVDAGGNVVASVGDIDAAVFPRSAVKVMQAIPLIESGAADRYRFGDAELALACASHSGEPRHVATAAGMLAAAGRNDLDLECGPQLPTNHAAANDLIRSGRAPLPIHNNCSGKHAGFICTACHLGVAPAGYVGVEHPIQREIAAAMAAITDMPLAPDACGIDGCSIPTWPIPIVRLALGFARLVTGDGLSPVRADAARRLIDACMAEPFLVAGTGRFDTDVMSALPGRVFVKGGAEGVAAAALPEFGLGVFMKADDGAGRAVEVMMAAVIDALLPMTDAERAALADRLVAPVTSRRGARVGEMRPVDGLVEGLRGAG